MGGAPNGPADDCLSGAPDAVRDAMGRDFDVVVPPETSPLPGTEPKTDKCLLPNHTAEDPVARKKIRELWSALQIKDAQIKGLHKRVAALSNRPTSVEHELGTLHTRTCRLEQLVFDPNPADDPESTPYGSPTPLRRRSRRRRVFGAVGRAAKATGAKCGALVVGTALIATKPIRFGAHMFMVLLPLVVLLGLLVAWTFIPHWGLWLADISGWTSHKVKDAAADVAGTVIFLTFVGTIIHLLYRASEGRWWWREKGK